jgi:hypothetical protein
MSAGWGALIAAHVRVDAQRPDGSAGQASRHMHGHTCKQQGRFSEIIIVRAVLR